MKKNRKLIGLCCTNKRITQYLQQIIRTIGKQSLISFILLLAVSGAGCASIVKSKGRKISFESTPPGATVRMKGAVVGKTPCTAMVKGAPLIMFELQGYSPDPTSIHGWYKMEPWVFGNLIFLFGAPVGVIVDSLNERITRVNSTCHMNFIKAGERGPSVFTDSNNPFSASFTSQPVIVNKGADRLKALKELKDQGIVSDAEYEVKKAELLKDL